MEKGVTLGVLIVMFLGIIVTLAILPEIAVNTKIISSQIPTINDSIDISAARNASGTINNLQQFNVTNENTGWRITEGECAISSYTFANASGTAYTLDTDYKFSTAYGNFTLINTTTVFGSTNITKITYSYCGFGYSTSGATRSMINIVLIFVALGLVVFTIYYSVRQYF